MYLKIASNPSIDKTIQTIRELNLRLQSKIDYDRTISLFERSSDLHSSARKEECLYLLQSGEVELIVGNKGILHYEAGDFVGIEALLPTDCQIIAKNFAVEVVKIPLRSIEEQTNSDTLLKLISNHAAFFLATLSATLPDEENFEPDIFRIEKGQKIVEQGTFGDDIFTLIDGHADVFVDGSKVGEVKGDEIFGALAAMTNISRTATIVASEDCLVMKIKKSRLVELIKLRPATVEKLISDLARVIQDLNKKLAGHCQAIPS